MRSVLPIFGALCMVLAGCSDDEPVVPERVVYEGITQTNPVGDILQEDPDDWRDTPGMVIGPAFPNPVWGPSVTIKFFTRENADVRVVIRTPDRIVRTLFAGALQAGTQTLAWDRKTDSGEDAALDIYRVVIEASMTGGGNESSYGDVQLDPIGSPAPAAQYANVQIDVDLEQPRCCNAHPATAP